MQIGMIGLGRMGDGMVGRLLSAGHACVMYDKQSAAVGRSVGAVWLMVPAAGVGLMIGGEAVPFEHLRPIFSALAPGAAAATATPGRGAGASSAAEGYLRRGPHGAGHFVKMVHNGIGYGLMAAYAEGLNILRSADVGKAELAPDPASQREHDAETTPLRNPEGRWTLHAAIDEGVPVPVLSAALFERFSSRGDGDFAYRVLSAMWDVGHAEKSAA